MFLMFTTDRCDTLFSRVRWFDVAEHQKRKLKEDVAGIDGNRLLNTSVDDLCAYLCERYSVDVPSLRRDEIIADQRETQIDVSEDFRRFFRESGPHHVTGTEVEIAIPFDGDQELFRVQPTRFTLNRPRGDASNGVLRITIAGSDLQADAVRREIEQVIGQIDECLTTLRENSASLANELPVIARAAVEERRKKLLANQNLVASLGFKIKERSDSPRTYVAPNVRRKITPTPPMASAAPFKPEPSPSDDDYQHVLGVIENMAHVMERSPSAFVSMDEESLRSHFLVQLNGHYEGQATGETFNYEGKTDILIRTNGRNIFIGECKFWAGPKKLLETIDQLLGYSAWRDTKVGLSVVTTSSRFS